MEYYIQTFKLFFRKRNGWKEWKSKIILEETKHDANQTKDEMKRVKQFNNTKDLNNYLKYEAEEGEVVELNEVADWTHPKRITRFVK